ERPLFTETDLKEEKIQPKQEEKPQKTSEGSYRRVIQFTKKIKKMHGDIIKSVLIFGSAARKEAKKTSDIDVWVVVDDTATKGTEDILKIRTQLQLVGQEMKDIHVQMNGLTEFWGWMKLGSPELFNFLRDGLVIYDTGFIKPVQRMLKMGLLPPSEETVGLKVRSCDGLVKRVEASWKADVFDLRYAATDICQAVIMHYYKETPDHKRMPTALEKLVKEHGLEKEYIEKYKRLDKLWKDLDHKIVKKPTPEYVAKADKLSREIIERLTKLLPKDLQKPDIPGML
ncbi:MAG: nucleotidyltransferase domain-containing protein, partial [Candidatus Aenigmarchaeota archaeon]|nr:nucleotidyltransferase domain-containing protein [Candidatus Aenigmarchaeota archaeon]